MRYYGMSNNPNRTITPDMEEKPAVALPSQPQSSAAENRTFNRPDPTSGLYNGQQAQNVTSVRDWVAEQPPAVLPPRPDNFQAPTVYEYPASQPSTQEPTTQNSFCRIKTDFLNHLCNHIGDYAYIALSDGMEKRGTLEAVGKDFIAISDSGNHIMCPLNAISSINILKPMR